MIAVYEATLYQRMLLGTAQHPSVEVMQQAIQAGYFACLAKPREVKEMTVPSTPMFGRACL